MKKEIKFPESKGNARFTIFVAFFMLSLCIIWWFCMGVIDFEFSSIINKPSINQRISIICYITTIWIIFSIFDDYRKCRYSFYHGYKTIIIQLWGYLTSIIYIISISSSILTCMIVVNIIYGIYYLQVNKLPLPKTVIPKEDDWLYRSRLFNRTHRQIRSLAKDNMQGLTIGICGQWGSGKTFFINDLLNRLSKITDSKTDSSISYNDAFVICEKIELWTTHSLNDAWDRIINTLQTAILNRHPFSSGFLKKVINVILSICNLNNKAASEIVDLVLSNMNRTNVQAIKEAMGNKKYILVFDDLERADFKTIQAMLPLFERLKALPNLIVICAIAENELIQEFERNKVNADFAHGHLNKLFDLRIEIPQLPYSAIKHFQNKLLAEKYNDCKLTRSFFDKYPLRFDNVRQMQRIIEKLTNIEKQYYNGCIQFFTQEETENDDNETLSKLKFVFLVEALRIARPKVLKLLSHKENILNFLQTTPNCLLPYGYQILKFEDEFDFSPHSLTAANTNKENNTINSWITENPEMYSEIINYKIVRSILTIIRYDHSVSSDYNKAQINFVYACNANYTRCTILQDWEKQYILKAPNYFGITYKEKIEKFFSESEEMIETPSYPEAIRTLFRYELQKLKEEKNNLNEMVETIEKEYQTKDFTLSLYNLDPLDIIAYTHFAYDIINQEDFTPFVKKDFSKLFVQLFKIMSIREQGRVLYIYNIGGFINDEKSTKLFKENTFKDIVKDLSHEYGYNLAYQISSPFINELIFNNLNDDFTVQAYKLITDTSLISDIKNGVISFIRHLESIEDYVHKWILFMGIQYRSPKIRGGIESSFSSKAVFEMMEMIKNQLIDKSGPLHTLKNKSQIHEACKQTLTKLYADREQWCNVISKNEYVSGLDNLISMIEGIRDSITSNEYEITRRF